MAAAEESVTRPAASSRRLSFRAPLPAQWPAGEPFLVELELRTEMGEPLASDGGDLTVELLVGGDPAASATAALGAAVELPMADAPAVVRVSGEGAMPAYSRPIAVGARELAPHAETLRRYAPAAAGPRFELVESTALAGFVGVVWDCALGVMRALAERPALLPAGARVVELGAGTGAVGLYAQLLGRAREVVVTDMARVLPLLRANVALNGLAVRVAELEWGAPNLEALLDGAPFDVCVASDVLYDPAEWEALLRSVRAVTRVGGRFVLGHRLRTPWEEMFFDWAKAVGLRLLWQQEAGEDITVYEFEVGEETGAEVGWG